MTDPIRPALVMAFEVYSAWRAGTQSARPSNMAPAIIEADRAAIRADERVKIVAWLRSTAAWNSKMDDGLSGLDKMSQGQLEAADAIERGEHTGGGDA